MSRPARRNSNFARGRCARSVTSTMRRLPAACSRRAVLAALASVSRESGSTSSAARGCRRPARDRASLRLLQPGRARHPTTRSVAPRRHGRARRPAPSGGASVRWAGRHYRPGSRARRSRRRPLWCHCERSEAISCRFFLTPSRLLRRSARRNDTWGGRRAPFFTTTAAGCDRYASPVRASAPSMRWARAAPRKRSMSPSSTAPVLPVSTPVRRSFTI